MRAHDDDVRIIEQDLDIHLVLRKRPDDVLDEEVGSIEQALRGLEADIAKLQAKLREARVRQNAVATRLESAENRVRMREARAMGLVM